jgi:hypothetical protein
MRENKEQVLLRNKGFSAYVDARGLTYYSNSLLSIRPNGTGWLVYHCAKGGGRPASYVAFRNPVAAATYAELQLKDNNTGGAK